MQALLFHPTVHSGFQQVVCTVGLHDGRPLLVMGKGLREREAFEMAVRALRRL